jgi:hypothetical protein
MLAMLPGAAGTGSAVVSLVTPVIRVIPSRVSGETLAGRFVGFEAANDAHVVAPMCHVGSRRDHTEDGWVRDHEGEQQWAREWIPMSATQSGRGRLRTWRSSFPSARWVVRLHA